MDLTPNPQSKPNEDWMQKKWRPAMGWMYMFICLLDMAIFPVLWSLLQVSTGQVVTQWNPLTLQGAGLFHLAMGAVLGIAAWGRTQEKVAGASTLPTTVSSTPVPMMARSYPSPVNTQITDSVTQANQPIERPIPTPGISRRKIEE